MADEKNKEAFLKLINSPFKFRMFMLQKLPAAFFSGVRLISADRNFSKVSVPYKWFTQNPFRSTYFACLSMAAEMSTGLLAMSNTYKKDPAVSMLVVGVDSKYFKKANTPTIFTCNDGQAVKEIIEKAITTKEPQSIKMYAQGTNTAGEAIADFWITWSFKVRGEK